jgi:signal transduction histidine kinase
MQEVLDRKRQLRLATRRRGGMVVLSVDDSGPGIDPDRIESIFAPFVTTKPSGMGMGLSICRSIVEGHKGTLSVSNLNPFGTRFEVILPEPPDVPKEVLP